MASSSLRRNVGTRRFDIDGAGFMASNLPELYRLVISRHDRLDQLIAMRAPEIIVRNEKRMLREAVGALIKNSEIAEIVAHVGASIFTNYLNYIAGTEINASVVDKAAASTLTH